jgi:hypothetical protein
MILPDIIVLHDRVCMIFVYNAVKNNNALVLHKKKREKKIHNNAKNAFYMYKIELKIY